MMLDCLPVPRSRFPIWFAFSLRNVLCCIRPGTANHIFFPNPPVPCPMLPHISFLPPGNFLNAKASIFSERANKFRWYINEVVL